MWKKGRQEFTPYYLQSTLFYAVINASSCTWCKKPSAINCTNATNVKILFNHRKYIFSPYDMCWMSIMLHSPLQRDGSSGVLSCFVECTILLNAIIVSCTCVVCSWIKNNLFPWTHDTFVLLLRSQNRYRNKMCMF